MRRYFKKRRFQPFRLSLNSFLLGLVVISIAPFFTPLAIAGDSIAGESAEDNKWKYNVELFASPGDERDLTGFDILFPLWQNTSSLAFMDFRATRSSEDTTEFSLGTGYRKFKADFIYGANLFYDTRTTSVNNRFNQITVGFEVLSIDWDFRFNIYTPASDSESVDSDEPADQFFGRRIYIAGVREEVLEGFDIEVGYLMKALKWETRVFLAGYTLSGDHDETADGARLSFEVRPQKNVSLSLNYQNDSLFDSQLRGELRYSFAYPHTKELRQLRERMLETSRRDVD